MYVIFGTYTKRHIIGLYNVPCHACGSPMAVQQGVIEKKAFNMFWIPLIPLGSKKRLVCSKCGNVLATNDFSEQAEIPLDGPAPQVVLQPPVNM